MMPEMLKEKKFLLKSDRAFTLIEALMTVLIFSMIFGVCLMTLLSGTASWQVNSVKVELQQEIRKTVDWMSLELRQSGPSQINNAADGTWYNSIIFKTSAGVSGGAISWSANSITYQLSGGQFQRVSGGGSKVVAQDITALQFRRQAITPDIVEVNMTAQKKSIRKIPLSQSYSFKIQLRNT